MFNSFHLKLKLKLFKFENDNYKSDKYAETIKRTHIENYVMLFSNTLCPELKWSCLL